MKNVIIKVEKESIAEELGIEVGDFLKSINEKEVKDVFDYRYLINDEYIEVCIIKPSGEEWILEIEKDVDEDLGIVFESGLMDKAKSCTNKCIFCFIDQLPKGMRKTLYFKDDDSRLSFLQGNYVTLTNMKEEDLDRIIFYHLSPINISVHTTDMELREFMLKNPNSKKMFQYIEKISAAGIEMNFQVVLCKGVNDGIQLKKTIKDLSKFIPKGRSMSVVPVGLSKYRDNLYKLDQFTKEDCANTIKLIENFQKEFLEKFGTRFVFASDEFYLVGDIPIPDYKSYEDFPQIENGVGMISNFSNEIDANLYEYKGCEKVVSVITGQLAFNTIKEICDKIMKLSKNIKINIFNIKNNFFGERITVSGLLTGIDIIENLQEKELGEYVLLPISSLRENDDVFLDNINLLQVSQSINKKIIPVEIDGKDFIEKIYNGGNK